MDVPRAQRRANRLGRSLLARGLRREDVVAVVTERNLDLMAAALAVFKAGGVYLPIEPHFPAERIAATLTRAGCRLMLTERGSTTNLDQALEAMPDVEALAVDAAYAEDHGASDLGVAVAADQLAYIYFTSGSTGEPKGAMCEHAGFLNHVVAKIDDLEIGEGQVVAQTAPQCFDISLWQLLAAVLVGGRTLLVEQEAILDIDRFIDTIVCGGVSVLQVVPSYLEVVLTSLERHPRALSDLRFVSVTGEALKKELTQRWFAAEPGIKLVNAYGVQNTARFAFFGDEESGAQGSSGYVEGLSADDRKKIKLYLNVDMVASPNGGYFVQGGKGRDAEEAGPPGSATIARVLADQLTKTGVTTPEVIEFVGDDESPFIEAGIPVGGAENGDDEKKTAKQAEAWGGQAGEPYDRCYHEACDNIDNVNRDMLDHYMRAIAGTLAHFATSTDELR